VILICPGCGARYRLDESKLSGEQARLRCRKCGASLRAIRESSPAAVPETAGSPASPTASRAASPRRTALLADEAREFRDFVQAELHAAGYEVSTTESGQEALLLAGSHPFDLIVLNAYLRELLGIHVCGRIKANPALKATPVLLLGALVGPDAGAANRYGADDLISTGISKEDLAARIARFSRGGASGSDPASATTQAPTGAAPLSAPPAAAPATGGKPATGDEAEIRRLARIMISDIEIYHPEKFSRALRDGTFFEAFSEELAHGKEMVDRRFPHVANRIQVLAAGLRDCVETYRAGGSPRRASLG
jgi:predicted Zn finger-like uncharacterized protein